MDKMLMELEQQMMSLLDSDIVSDNKFGEECSAVNVLNDILEIVGGERIDNSEGLYNSTIRENEKHMREMARSYGDLLDASKKEYIRFLDQFIQKSSSNKELKKLNRQCQNLRNKLKAPGEIKQVLVYNIILAIRDL